MRHGKPIVLMASVSVYECQFLESALEKTRWHLIRVQDAEEAAQHLDGAERPAVLVIDSGLLDAHEPRWRLLRAQHPGLGTVVRCLVARDPGLQERDDRTFLVHPDDVEGMCWAVRAAGGPSFASS